MARRSVEFELRLRTDQAQQQADEFAERVDVSSESVDEFADRSTTAAEEVEDSMSRSADATNEQTQELSKSTDQAESFGSAADSLPGPLGRAVGSLKSVTGMTRTWSKALWAIPLVAVAGLLAGLISAFKGTERGQRAFIQITEVASAVFERFMGVLEKVSFFLVDNVKRAFTEPLQVAKDVGEAYIDIFKTVWGFIGRTAQNTGQIIISALTGDFDQVRKSWDAMKNEFQGIGDAIADVGRGVAGFFDDAIERGNRLSDLMQRQLELERDMIIPMAEQNRIHEEARKQMRDQTLSTQERFEASQRAEQAAREELAMRREMLENELEIAKERSEMNDDDLDAQRELNEAKAALIELDTQQERILGRVVSMGSTLQEQAEEEKIERQAILDAAEKTGLVLEDIEGLDLTRPVEDYRKALEAAVEQAERLRDETRALWAEGENIDKLLNRPVERFAEQTYRGAQAQEGLTEEVKTSGRTISEVATGMTEAEMQKMAATQRTTESIATQGAMIIGNAESREEAANRIIDTLIAEIVAYAIRSAIQNIPFPLNIPAAAAAGLAAQGLKSQIPSFRQGVTDFEGGLARVHRDELLVNMAPGTTVIPADQVEGLASRPGFGGAVPQVNANVVLNANEMNNTLDGAKWAQTTGIGQRRRRG